MKTVLQPLLARFLSSSQEKSAKERSARRNGAADILVDDQARPDKTAWARPPTTEMHLGGRAAPPPVSEQPHSSSSSQPRPPVQAPVQVPSSVTDATPLQSDVLPRIVASRKSDNSKNVTGTPPPSSSSTLARGRGPASQLPIVVDEGYEEGGLSCSHIAPPSENHDGQNTDDAAPAARGTNRLSWFRHSIAASATTTPADAMPGATTKIHHKPSFRDRFWSASSSNDFGDTADSRSSRRDEPSNAPPTTSTKRAPYVPRHAATDFTRTTKTLPLQHRQSASWDGRNSYTHRTAPPPPIDEENPFTDSHETSTLCGDTIARPPQQQHRFSAPPAALTGRDSITEADERPFSDYEQFLAHAAAEERAQRVEAARRSWRNGGEGSRRDSAYYSASGRRGDSTRTSEDDSGGSTQQQQPRASTDVVAGAKRHIRTTQMIAEYIKPPREEQRRVGNTRTA